MNAIGANTWIWVSPATDERLAGLAPKIKAWGFDQIEIPIEQPTDWEPARTAALLRELELRVSVCCVMAPGRDFTVEDRATVAATRDYLCTCVDVAATVGANVVGGPMYAPTGKTWAMEPGERRTVVGRIVEGLRPVANYAGERGVALAIEPINRFETSVVNTAEQALELLEGIDSPACGVLLDTFHMNIEEKSPAAAIRAVGARLVHVHACGSDRGAPGADHTNWEENFAALTEIGYGGALVIESFTAENTTIATAAAIWRRLAPTQDELATAGLAFLREMLATRAPGRSESEPARRSARPVERAIAQT
ncbi:MAG TPA: sugar phosphate isomerase/epimerase family protein [Thermomicrobiales bacterium]|jgi:D-psicose/D-tagatose/L-ribulose 3-epimerase